MTVKSGSRVAVSGGYDFEPEWLGGAQAVTGRVAKWIPGQNSQPACVVLLDFPLIAIGDVRGRRERREGRYIVLGLRYQGQEWETSGTVHVELLASEPTDLPWSEREQGAWVESHATYTVLD
ncbi:hypothetical protein [Nocardioides currus]|uniref:hypothetical protein n=1 Tax=Nocardioides currus TaxID=2133958 RepID=UPI0010571ED0|nr:hypothetical protein [Nocardioides currus]